jgi:formate transporter
MLVQDPAAPQLVTAAGMAANLVFVIGGNLLGGSVLVGLTYHVIYGRRRAEAPAGRIEPS